MTKKSITIFVDDFTKFQMFQESLQESSSSNPIATIAETGNTKCLLTSSTEWVIDSSVIAHMTDYSNLFSTPMSPTSFPSITLADGSTFSVRGSNTTPLTLSLSLSMYYICLNCCFI